MEIHLYQTSLMLEFPTTTVAIVNLIVITDFMLSADSRLSEVFDLVYVSTPDICIPFYLMITELSIRRSIHRSSEVSYHHDSFMGLCSRNQWLVLGVLGVRSGVTCVYRLSDSPS